MVVWSLVNSLCLVGFRLPRIGEEKKNYLLRLPFISLRASTFPTMCNDFLEVEA